MTESIGNATATVAREKRKVEIVKWHPAADNILAASVHNTIKVYDVRASQEKYGQYKSVKYMYFQRDFQIYMGPIFRLNVDSTVFSAELLISQDQTCNV